PFLTFVAVRAIAPVAGMPPKSGEAILATPWATNSKLDLWRPPIMPSATTADNSDSIAAKSATAVADGNNVFISGQETDGHCQCGKPCGIPPNRLPMVSTGQ